MKLNHITKAKVDDADAIAYLLNTAYRGESSRQGWTNEADILDGVRTTPEEIAGVIQRDGAFLLKGMLGNEIVATICCELHRVSAKHGVPGETSGIVENSAHFGMIAVNPRLQNNGVGRQIIQAAESMSNSEWQVKHYQMAVITLRKELIAFYARLGYLPNGEFKEFPQNSALWQPKVEGLQLQYLVKSQA